MNCNDLNEETPLFTIGIASYNYEKYIIKELDAIKEQEFKDYEVLISDDCSSDNSVEVIRSYIKEHPDMRIRLIESPVNEGIVANKNKIVENSRGKYLMICDSDDWMGDHCLQRMAEVIEREHPDRVLTEVANVKPDGEVIQVQHLLPTQSKWCWTIHHGGGYRRDLLVKYHIRMLDGMPDDLYFITEFNKYCKKTSLIPEVLYYWNVNMESAGRKEAPAFRDLISDSEKVLKYIYDTIDFMKNRMEGCDKREIEELRFLGLKMYYFNILFPLQSRSLKEKNDFYRQVHVMMKKQDENYLHNTLLRGRQMPVRKGTFRIIQLCVALERIKMFRLALAAFHLLTRFTYIDQ